MSNGQPGHSAPQNHGPDTSEPDDHTPAPRAPDAVDNGQWTEPQILFMKRAIAVMSTILILGFMLLIWRIMNLTTTTDDTATAPQISAVPTPGPASGSALIAQSGFVQLPAFKADATLTLPPGAVIRQASLSGQLLAVHYSAPTGTAIAVINLTTGKTLSTVRVVNKAP